MFVHRRSPQRLSMRAAGLCLGLCLFSGMALAQTGGRCNGLSNPEPRGIREPVPLNQGEAAPLDPQSSLQLLVREAVRRSQEVGASRLLAEAAGFDLNETRAGRLPQVSFNGFLGAGGAQTVGVNTSANGARATVGVNLSAPLYDFGRLQSLIDWRTRLADAAKLGENISQERVALEVVNTALERQRYRLQSQVYQQQVRKMACLVDALEQIVAADKGRSSELVQARKSLQQAELSRDQLTALVRQVEITLRKFVGEQVSLNDSFVGALMATPDLAEVNNLIERHPEVMRARQEAEAQDSYADAIKAGQKPQLNWQVSGNGGRSGEQTVRGWGAGVSVTWSLFNGGALEAASMAAFKRAQSARAGLGQTLLDRQTRAAQLHDAALTSMERARSYVALLRDTEKVRQATFQQWSQLGRRSLFDVMSAETDHFSQRVAYVNALMDSAQSNASLRSVGEGLMSWARP
jgi:adhesin transport system outer membrane protein